MRRCFILLSPILLLASCEMIDDLMGGGDAGEAVVATKTDKPDAGPKADDAKKEEAKTADAGAADEKKEEEKKEEEPEEVDIHASAEAAVTGYYQAWIDRDADKVAEAVLPSKRKKFKKKFKKTFKKKVTSFKIKKKKVKGSKGTISVELKIGKKKSKAKHSVKKSKGKWYVVK